jgi:NAD(P)H-flavin reductase
VLSDDVVPGWRRGRVSDALADDRPALAGAKAYVAGPPAMVEATAATLRALGLAPADIHADVFFTLGSNDATLSAEASP